MMKNKIASLAIMGMTILSTTAFAQKPAKNASQPPRSCEIQISDASAVCPANGRQIRHGQCDMMAFDFSSLELTADQKSKIDMLNQTQRKQLEQCRRDRKESKEAMKADARQKRQDVRKNYLNGLRTILSPEQYTKFLEDNFVNGNPNNARKAHKMKFDRKNRIRSAEFKKAGKAQNLERANDGKTKSK